MGGLNAKDGECASFLSSKLVQSCQRLLIGGQLSKTDAAFIAVRSKAIFGGKLSKEDAACVIVRSKAAYYWAVEQGGRCPCNSAALVIVRVKGACWWAE
eukprot:363177-Chlamydomonas_euryale.AAC.2